MKLSEKLLAAIEDAGLHADQSMPGTFLCTEAKLKDCIEMLKKFYPSQPLLLMGSQQEFLFTVYLNQTQELISIKAYKGRVEEMEQVIRGALCG